MEYNRYKSASPGIHVRLELGKLLWTQKDLGFVLGLSQVTINRIVKGKSRITPKLSKDLGYIFSCDERRFLDLQADYDLLRAADTSREIKDRALSLMARER